MKRRHKRQKYERVDLVTFKKTSGYFTTVVWHKYVIELVSFNVHSKSNTNTIRQNEQVPTCNLRAQTQSRTFVCIQQSAAVTLT